MIAYTQNSSKEKNTTIIKEKITNGVLLDKGIKIKGKIEIPFFRLEEDMYLVADYSSKMKLIYNERTLGIFLKNTGNLLQMRRSAVIDTHEFFFTKQ